jgi:hypothetical protein
MPEHHITQELVRELFICSPNTPHIIRRVDSRRYKAGTIVGCRDHKGYVLVHVKGRNYRAHHIVWLYFHGKLPMHQLDHINGIRDDNRISNLREATNAENSQNRQPTGSIGLLGVSFEKKRNRYKSQIKVNGRVKTLGYFKTPIEAYQTYLAAKRELHKFNPIPRQASA